MTDAAAPIPARAPVAIVTGAAGAIGSATVARFLADGATVVAVDRDADALARLPEGVDRHAIDVADETEVDAMVAAVLASHGRIDDLINCAGITRDGTIHKMTLEQWHAVLRVNLDATFLTTRAMVRHVRERGDGGSIVNLASISGDVGTFGQANYAASKAAVVALTKVTAREIARYGARANAISPGFIRSPMTDAIPDDVRTERIRQAPLARPGEPAEIAGIAAWLCGPDAAFVTGAVIDASGGRGM